jgi:endonuclease V-like protein UPF0215 family
MHIPKKGLRALGIAESYTGRSVSRLAGVVMRKDLRIDGFIFSTVTVGGMDATSSILRMVEELDRSDINVIMLSGCVIAWFNILNPALIAQETGIPVICVTYEDSDGLIEDIRYHFPDDTARISAYEDLGERIPVELHSSGYGVWISGMQHGCAMILPLKGRFPNPCAWRGFAPVMHPYL